MQKSFLLLICLSLLFISYAQEPTTAEIKTKKIKTKTVTYSGETPTVMIYYFDAMGNDTAIYYNAVRTSYKVYEYNKAGWPAKITAYNNNGKEKDVTTYTYKPDGSSTAVNIDAQFKMPYHYKYDKKGNILELKTPDGSVRKYNYNSKGSLIKIQSISTYESDRYVINYYYNTQNKVTKAVVTGDAPNTTLYEYDSKGMIKKISSTSEGITSSSTYEFGY